MLDATHPIQLGLALALTIVVAVGPLEGQDRNQVLARTATENLLLQTAVLPAVPQVFPSAQQQVNGILAKRAYLSVSDVELSAALDALYASAGVRVAYSPSLLPGGHRVTCECENLSIHRAVAILLAGTDLQVDVSGGQLIIVPRDRLREPVASLATLGPRRPFLSSRPFPQEDAQMIRSLMSYGRGVLAAGTIAAAMSADLHAQNHQVTGRVISSELQPLAGVGVQVRGTTIGTITNSNGNYTLTVPSANETLVFSFLGMVRQEQPIAGRNVINVTMLTEAIGLQEVVVVGYGQQTRATVSGSVSTISSDDIVRTSANTTAEMLVGKVAGINTRMSTVTGTNSFLGREPQDGRPGASAVLQVRNLGDPLFVIDGVPVSALEFNQLNGADIDNISILKDASASVYGFRAANGVVLVTTKRGSALRTPQFRVNAEYGWQNLPRNRDPMGWGNTAYQFQYSIIESQQNLGQPRTVSPQELELWRIEAPGYESHPSWPDFISSNAPQASLNANVSGGSDNSNYYLGIGHVTQDYVMPDNNFNRTNLQTNVSTEVFRGLTVGTELRGRQENHITVANTNSSTITTVGDPMLVYFQGIRSMWPHQDSWANGNRDYINGDVRYFIRSPGSFRRDVGGTMDQIRTNFNGNLWAEYSLPLGATVRGTYSRTKDLEEFDIHRYTFHGYCYDAATDIYNICDTYEGKERRQIRAVEWRDFINVQLSHSLQRGSHSLSSVTALERSGGESTQSQIYAIPASNFNSLIDPSEVLDARTNWDINRRASYLGRVNYDYQQKYLLEALGRYDGSYLYAPGNRWGFFPGFSAGWRITEEPFVRNAAPFLHELKLRASWGQAGREQLPNNNANWSYLEGATYGSGTPSVLTGQVVPGIGLRGLPITNLSWVTSTSRNVGVDFIILQGKLSGELDLFERKLTGLPASRYDVALPSELGYTLPNENLESEANIGFDGMIRYSSQFGRVSYSVSPNFTLARRKILERYRPRYGSSWDEYRNAIENRWAGTNFNWHFTGKVFQSMEEIARHPVDQDGQGNRSLLPGDLIWEDTNGDGIINAMDHRVRGFGLGTPPILNFGLNGSFSYAGFNLSYDFAGGALYSLRPDNNVAVPYGTDHNGGTYIWSRWRRVDPYDDNSEWIPGKFPPLRKAQNSHSSYRFGDDKHTNVKYLRLRRMELGYEIPTNVSSRIGFAQLRAFTSATNAFLLDNTQKWGIDPEIAYGGSLLYPYPNLVNMGFSATIGGDVRSIPAVPVPPTDDN